MKTIRWPAVLIAGLFCCLALPVAAQDEPNTEDLVLDEESLQAMIDSLEAPLDWHTGVIDLGDGVAALAVPEGFRYLDAEDARYVLEELWGNPPAETWGMLFPADQGPLSDYAWGIDIMFLEDGYVNDDDAADIDYEDLLEDLREATEEENEMRQAEGYESIALVGWASPPYYDAEAKKLHWAKEYTFGEVEENTLNYNIRILGRRGVLILNAIGTMSQFDAIQHAVPPVLAAVDFNAGHRYSDFDPDLDKVAAYGIAGLIAGKVLTKAGFFVLIAKFWKVIAAGAIGVFALVKKFVLGKKSGDEPAPTNA